jgi:gliding motility-associated lipoprotein GldD
MVFPDRIPGTINLNECPFTFDFPTYAQVNRNTTYFDEATPHPCWFDLHLPDFNADLFLSYHPISSRKDFDKLVGDSYKIANQINRRSDYMEESSIKNNRGVSGMKFLFEGAAASPIHFYLSDTTQHFVKGALYYNEKVRPDSLLPATEFIMEDIDGLLASFQWR